MRAGDAVPKDCALLEGPAAREIVEAAVEWDADLIVMGTHGRGRVASFLMGSTAQEVIREARCPVLAVPDRPSPDHDERAGYADSVAGADDDREQCHHHGQRCCRGDDEEDDAEHADLIARQAC